MKHSGNQGEWPADQQLSTTQDEQRSGKSQASVNWGMRFRLLHEQSPNPTQSAVEMIREFRDTES